MFIPWGDIKWVAARLRDRNWTYLGCLSREDRCLAVLDLNCFDTNNVRMVRIFDADPLDKDEELRALEQRTAAAVNSGVSPRHIIDAPLLASLDDVSDVLDMARSVSRHIALDISCFPKRWFFPLVRMALLEHEFDDVLVLYTGAQRYGAVLSYNPECIRTLPGFTSISRRSSCDVAVVSIGYHSHSVFELFDVERPRSLRILFPFPPGPPGIIRNWRFVERLDRSIRIDDDDRHYGARLLQEIRVGALDVPQNFMALEKVTNGGLKTALVAPFGPKPVSLAMCLFSLAAEVAGRPEVPVYYSQPTRYAADYTTGIEVTRGHPAVLSYPLKINQRMLYVL